MTDSDFTEAKVKLIQNQIVISNLGAYMINLLQGSIIRSRFKKNEYEFIDVIGKMHFNIF